MKKLFARCFIQEMPGHADIKTTQIHAQVSIRQLKQIHSATHPAHLWKPETAAPSADAAAKDELLSFRSRRRRRERAAMIRPLL